AARAACRLRSPAPPPPLVCRPPWRAAAPRRPPLGGQSGSQTRPPRRPPGVACTPVTLTCSRLGRSRRAAAIAGAPARAAARSGASSAKMQGDGAGAPPANHPGEEQQQRPLPRAPLSSGPAGPPRTPGRTGRPAGRRLKGGGTAKGHGARRRAGTAATQGGAEKAEMGHRGLRGGPPSPNGYARSAGTESASRGSKGGGPESSSARRRRQVEESEEDPEVRGSKIEVLWRARAQGAEALHTSGRRLFANFGLEGLSPGPGAVKKRLGMTNRPRGGCGPGKITPSDLWVS
ncbi:unnamed protein product, partial [Prorocentrum cordatum]